MAVERFYMFLMREKRHRADERDNELKKIK